MTDKELYQQKMQAQLDEWQAEVDKLKAWASDASADARLELNQKADNLRIKVDEGNAKLAKLQDASEDAWDSLKEGIDAAWNSMKSAFK